LFCLSIPLNAQSYEPSQMTTEQLLTLADESLTRLEIRLTERSTQIESLESELLISNVLIRQAQSSLEKSESALAETSKKLDSLTKRFDTLSARFEAYRAEAEAQINALALEVKVYKTATYIAVPTAVIAVGVIAGRLVGWW